MAQDDFARLQGCRVTLEGASGPFRSCPVCGCEAGQVAQGSGPHLAAVRCANCAAHVSWLSRGHLTAMLAKHRGAA